MVENKTVGADSISARGTLSTAGRAHIECAPTAAENFERSAATRTTNFIIYSLKKEQP